MEGGNVRLEMEGDQQHGHETVDQKIFDYVMVFDIKTQLQFANEMKEKLIKMGLVVKEERSRDDDEIFLFITTTTENFIEEAERMGLRKRLKSDNPGQGPLTEFTREKLDSFEYSMIEGTLFSSYERAQIVRTMIESKRKGKGFGIVIDNWIRNGKLKSCFVLSEDKAEALLMSEWIKKWWTPQPLTLIKDYFGTYIALYFGWLGYYTLWLVPSSLVSFIMLIIAMVEGFDNKYIPFYCLFLAFWATFFLEFWKRKNAEYNAEWDMAGFEEQERVRCQFRGEKKMYGAYVGGVFIPLEPKKDFVPPRVDWVPDSSRTLKIGAGMPLLATFLVVVVIATFGIFVFRSFVKKHVEPIAGAIMAGCLNSVFIMSMNMLYRRLALFLTNWENWRTESDYENAFIQKNFLFQFVNGYISLFYIAFMKGRNWAKSLGLDEQCDPSCMYELSIQLGSIFLTSIFIGQFMEVGYPWLKGKVSLLMEERAMKTKVEATAAEKESKLWAFTSTFDDYNEMAIQFGYITLFAAAFPLAPIAALVNNIVELRSDALKLLYEYQRPHPRETANIGTWQTILEVLGYIAVITNCALLAFTSEKLDDVFPSFKDHPDSKIWAALITEHIILFLKYVISEVIPDEPQWVKVKNATKEFWRDYHLGVAKFQEEEDGEISTQQFDEKSRLLNA